MSLFRRRPYLLQAWRPDSTCELWYPLYKFGYEQAIIPDMSGKGHDGTKADIDPAPYAKVNGFELVSNGQFETDPNTEWTETDCTIASVAGGIAGKCMQVTRTGGVCQYFEQTVPVTAGKTYRLGGWVKSGTAGNKFFRFYYGSGDGITTGTTSAGWVYYEAIFVATTTNGLLSIFKDTNDAGTMLFDAFSIQEVTGYEGIGWHFNGASSQISAGTVTIGTSDFTALAWVRPDMGIGTNHYFIGCTGANGAADWDLYTSGLALASVHDSVSVSAAGITLSEWRCVGFTADRDGNGQMYVSGVASGATTDISGHAATSLTGTCYIGRAAVAGWYHGQMGEVVICKRLLTAAEINEYYNRTRGRYGA